MFASGSGDFFLSFGTVTPPPRGSHAGGLRLIVTVQGIRKRKRTDNMVKRTFTRLGENMLKQISLVLRNTMVKRPN